MDGKKILVAFGFEETSRKDVLDVIRCAGELRNALLERGYSVEMFKVRQEDFKDPQMISSAIATYNPICIFNLFEGFSDDASKEIEFADILENTGIPFTGNASYTLDVCLNKQKAKQVLRDNAIQVPKGMVVEQPSQSYACGLEYPVFVKPCCEDASLGIDDESIVSARDGLSRVIEKKLRDFPSGLLVEEFISGREYNVGLIGDSPYLVLGISVLDYGEHPGERAFLSYGAKWESSCSAFGTLLPRSAESIDAVLKSRIESVARKAAHVLQCRGYCRVDMREREKELFVLEVNPNPDINRDSGFMKQSYARGYTYEDIIEKILNAGLERGVYAALKRG
ncbi:MAG: ATP-grasp domain-containing protein [bacterium]